MARGRSIDKALPPTRALTQQRDYRARKAARIEQLEKDNALLVAENDRLRDELNTLRHAEQRVETAERELEEAWRRLREEQEEWTSRREEDYRRLPRLQDGMGEVGGRISHLNLVGMAEAGAEGMLRHQERSQPDPTPLTPASLDRKIPPYHYPNPSSPSHQQPPPKKSCITRAVERPEITAFETDCCSGLLDCDALSKMPQQIPPLIQRPPTFPTPKETPFDPDCCSGLFDCNALSAIPPFPVDTGRSDLDILVDVATHATAVDG